MESYFLYPMGFINFSHGCHLTISKFIDQITYHLPTNHNHAFICISIFAISIFMNIIFSIYHHHFFQGLVSGLFIALWS